MGIGSFLQNKTVFFLAVAVLVLLYGWPIESKTKHLEKKRDGFYAILEAAPC